MRYVTWALLSRPPETVGRNARGQPEWRMRYDGGLTPLPRPVAQEEGGHVFETFMRGLAPQARCVPQNDAAVRPLPWPDAYAILAALGMLTALEGREAPEEHLARQQVAVERLVHDRGFRLRVLSA